MKHTLVVSWMVVLFACSGGEATEVSQLTDLTLESAHLDSSPENVFQKLCALTKSGGVVRKVFQDSHGNIWFGGEGEVHRFNGDTLISLEGIYNERGKGVTVKDIAEDKSGRIWFGHTGGVSVYDGRAVVNYSEKDGLRSDDVWSLAAGEDGVIWIGTIDGACTYDGIVFKEFNIPSGKVDSTRGLSSAEMIHCIAVDSSGYIWFGTNGGVYRFDGQALMNFSESDGLSNNYVGQIMAATDGTMWIGTTHNGVCRLDGDSITQIDALKGKEIWGLSQDQSGAIWVTGKHLGAYKIDAGAMTHFDREDGLNSAGIMSSLEDRSGRHWFAGVSGIFLFYKGAFHHGSSCD